MPPSLAQDLLLDTARRLPAKVALAHGSASWDYESLATATRAFAAGLGAMGVARGDRVGVWLDKRFEAVVSLFGAMTAGAAMVPINPVLRAGQVAHILQDCGVRVLVSSPARMRHLAAVLADCTELQAVILVPDTPATAPDHELGAPDLPPRLHTVHFDTLLQCSPRSMARLTEADLAAILYTSGSTGRPKGVMLSHRNLVAGADSVVSYLENGPDDVLLAVLPLSFDAGFSQLTTAFAVGAQVALLNYLLPRDVLSAIARHQVTGLTAVPPLWIQLAQLDWPAGGAESMRYFANTGGHMPLATLQALRRRMPAAKPYLMYGLTEAFRATYLPPGEVDRRPDSIGKAIPGAEILVLREDGSECGVNEPGELVQRGPHVALGYWNAPEATAQRFRPLRGREHRGEGGSAPELAVFSGDTVRRDTDGFLYFVGRRDELIKTSGYRVSPTEIEEALYATGLVAEAAAFGIPHPVLGQAIAATVVPRSAELASAVLINECRTRLPAYMVPSAIELASAPLPRNPNGKIDRKALAAALIARSSQSGCDTLPLSGPPQ